MPGVVRTRVGYAGGKKKNPTYHSIGDHSETIQIDYDPTKITYKDLLDVFWKTHNPCAASGSRQYMSAIFYQGDDQKKLALETRDREAARRKMKIATEIAPLTEFTRAEDYHQKYILRNSPAFLKAFKAIYPNEKDFTDSTAVARVNSYLSGHGNKAALEKELKDLGLPEALNKQLLMSVR